MSILHVLQAPAVLLKAVLDYYYRAQWHSTSTHRKQILKRQPAVPCLHSSLAFLTSPVIRRQRDSEAARVAAVRRAYALEQELTAVRQEGLAAWPCARQWASACEAAAAQCSAMAAEAEQQREAAQASAPCSAYLSCSLANVAETLLSAVPERTVCTSRSVMPNLPVLM